MRAGSEAKAVRSNTGREFSVRVLFFQNGSMFAVSEGGDRIGAISASIATKGGKPNTAKVIPSKHDPIFLSTISEKVSAMTNGICLVSLYTKAQLELEDMKAIMAAVMDIVGEDAGDER